MESIKTRAIIAKVETLKNGDIRMKIDIDQADKVNILPLMLLTEADGVMVELDIRSLE